MAFDKNTRNGTLAAAVLCLFIGVSTPVAAYAVSDDSERLEVVQQQVAGHPGQGVGLDKPRPEQGRGLENSGRLTATVSEELPQPIRQEETSPVLGGIVTPQVEAPASVPAQSQPQVQTPPASSPVRSEPAVQPQPKVEAPASVPAQSQLQGATSSEITSASENSAGVIDDTLAQTDGGFAPAVHPVLWILSVLMIAAGLGLLVVWVGYGFEPERRLRAA